MPGVCLLYRVHGEKPEGIYAKFVNLLSHFKIRLSLFLMKIHTLSRGKLSERRRANRTNLSYRVRRIYVHEDGQVAFGLRILHHGITRYDDDVALPRKARRGSVYRYDAAISQGLYRVSLKAVAVRNVINLNLLEFEYRGRFHESCVYRDAPLVIHVRVGYSN